MNLFTRVPENLEQIQKITKPSTRAHSQPVLSKVRFIVDTNRHF